MDQALIGSTVTVKFNGSYYQGTVVGLRGKRTALWGDVTAVSVRFTTGTGKTRTREYGTEALANYAANPSPRQRATERRRRYAQEAK